MAARVAITGMGAISAAGNGAQALWRAARDGSPCISQLDETRFPRARIKHAALIREDITQLLGDAATKLDRFAQLALLAAREAVEQADAEARLAGMKTAVIVGSGLYVIFRERQLERQARIARLTPVAAPQSPL